MPIQLECDACGRRVKVKEEYAGKRIRCPACEEPIRVPQGGDDFDVDFEEDEFEERPAAKSRGQRSAPVKQRAKPEPKSEKGWFRRNWHWVAVSVMLLVSFWPEVGMVIAGLIAALGLFLALIGGLVMVIIPFGKLFLGDPGTFLLMLLSSSARIRMMKQPDNHPYKVLTKKAFASTPGLLWTRGLFWKGLLVMVMMIPAAVINVNIPDFYKKFAGDDPPVPNNPNLVGPRQRPAVNPGQPNSNPRFRGGQNNLQPGVVPGGNPNPNPAAGNQEAGFPPQRPPAGNAQGGGQVFTYTITYDSFTGEGSVKDAALAALRIHPDFPEDSLKVDEQAKTIQFQYKARIAPGALAKLFGSRGFPKMSIRTSSQ